MGNPQTCKCGRLTLPATWLSEGTGLCPWCAEQRKQGQMQKPRALRWLHEWRERLLTHLEAR